MEVIPRGLKSLLTMLWHRVASDAVAVSGLGILCAAREPLSLDELGAVAGWNSVSQRAAFVTVSHELLVKTRREDGLAEYRLHHDSIREHIVEQLGPAAVRGHHAALAQKLATWPAPPEAAARRYALRHAIAHRIEAADWTAVGQIARDFGFLEAKCSELGVHDVEADVTRAAERCCAGGEPAIGRDLHDFSRALARESHWLRDEPAAIAGQLWNRLRRMGWTREDLDHRVRLPTESAAFLRVRHVVSRESPALVRDLVGHLDLVNACAVTPDGQRVISASSDTMLKIWDIETGRIVATLEGHTWGVTSCAVTTDGRRVISASGDKTLKIWDLGTGRIVRTLEGHTWRVNSCAITPDGRHVISASGDKTLKIWDLGTGHIVRTLEGHAGPVNSCTVTPDGQRVVSASGDKTLKVWDLDTGHVVMTLEGHAGWVTNCAVTPDGRRVVSASDDKTLKVWDLDTSHVATTLEGHIGWVTSCAVTPDGRRVISASNDETIKVWDLDTSHVIMTLYGHTWIVKSCVVTPDGRHVISTSDDKTLKVWDLDSGDLVRTPASHTGTVRSCAVTPDGRRIVSASGDKTLKVWDFDTGRNIATLEGHSDWVQSCVVTSDGQRVISASNDHTLNVWDLDTGHLSMTLKGHTGWVTGCAVTPDSRHVISASNDHTLKVWDLDTGRVIMSLSGYTGWVTSCAVTPDGRRVVLVSATKTPKVWDLDADRIVTTLKGHVRGANSCAVTPDGRHAISGFDDRTLKIWDLRTGRVVTTLVGHTAVVRSCAVTLDGRRVVSAAEDRTIKVWDLDTYQCIATHRGDAAFTAVLATATAICAGDRAGSLWFLDWPPTLTPAPLVLASASNAAPSELTTNPPLAQRFGMSRKLILFLAANPSDTNQLALDQECAAIERELRMTANRDDFEFRSAWAVTVDDMARHLMELDPTIIHFSGHGASSGSRPERSSAATRDLVGPSAGGSSSGIYLHAEQGGAQLVTARALAMMIKSAAPSARLVVLNACYSEAQADALRTAVDCVVGMTGAINDDAARSFAVGFYRALGNRRSVGHALEHAIATLAAKQYPDEDLPRCRARDGIDVHKVVLGAPT